MLTFRRLTILFFVCLLGLNLWNIFIGKSIGGIFHTHAALVYSVLLTLYFAISFAMAFLPCSGFHHPVICHGKTDKKTVSITFDDGPDPVKTPVILDILKKNGIRATFFCIGKNIPGQEQLLQRIVDEGHLAGNHSFSHSKWFDLFPSRRMKSELLETDRIIKQVTGRSPLFFRPPFGVVNPMVSNALKNMHWHVIGWNIRSLDTVLSDDLKILQRIRKRLKPGAIILLHDFTHFTENHLEELLLLIREEGFEVAPLDKLLKLPAYAS